MNYFNGKDPEKDKLFREGMRPTRVFVILTTYTHGHLLTEVH